MKKESISVRRVKTTLSSLEFEIRQLDLALSEGDFDYRTVSFLEDSLHKLLCQVLTLKYYINTGEII